MLLMLLMKASAKHLPVQRGQSRRTCEPANAPTQSFTEAALVPQWGSAESKSCAEKLFAAWSCATGSCDTTVTLPPWDRITAAANQIVDAAESRTEQDRENQQNCSC